MLPYCLCTVFDSFHYNVYSFLLVQVISRLLEIGLVENRKELSSKRRKKNKTSENQMSENDDLIVSIFFPSSFFSFVLASTYDTI